jgi:hypothetical protein
VGVAASTASCNDLVDDDLKGFCGCCEAGDPVVGCDSDGGVSEDNRRIWWYP